MSKGSARTACGLCAVKNKRKLRVAVSPLLGGRVLLELRVCAAQRRIDPSSYNDMVLLQVVYSHTEKRTLICGD